MNPNRQPARTIGGFTLLELVVVLAILAVLTSMAVVAVDGAADRARADRSNRLLEDLRIAITGGADSATADGRAGGGGFVADMGRLPTGVLVDGRWTMAELWTPPVLGQQHGVRAAILAHGVEAADEDPQVLVAGGWRGPYLRLAAGTDGLRDGWGNLMASPQTGVSGDPLAAAYPRLRTRDDLPVDAPAQAVAIIRHLGGNGRLNPADVSWDRDVEIRFTDAEIFAGAAGQVEILDEDGNPLPPTPGTPVVVRLYGPDPDDAAKIKVYKTAVDFSANPVTWAIPAVVSAGPTIGPRAARATLGAAAPSSTPAAAKSTVKQVILRPGVNAIHFRIQP